MGDTDTYYKFTGKKMKVIAEKYGNDLYKVKEKTVSKKQYNSYIKKLLSNTKNVKLKWHKNTEKNRKLYL